MGSWKNWWCHSTAWQKGKLQVGHGFHFRVQVTICRTLQTSKAETFTLDIPQNLQSKCAFFERDRIILRWCRNWRNNGQIPLVNLMHGKGPIYVELHCTVMARRAPLLFAQIFLELEDLFHHHTKYCERRGNQDYRRVTCLSQLSSLYFCVGSLCSLRSRSFPN